MGAIKDPVHGFIEISPLVERLIDRPEMQRLRRVKQLGMAHLVYPGANHTRFEHSLGTYHLADRLCEIHGIEEREVRAAALLHDLGHGPFSHVSEEALREAGAESHESRAAELVEGSEIASILEEEGLDPYEVSELLQGGGRFGEVVSSEVDVDRMDYLARDAHYTGASYGVTDYERLLHQVTIVDDELVVAQGGVEAAESLLVSRFLMQPTVYRHHVSRIAKCMVKSAISRALEDGEVEPGEIRALDDPGFLHRLGEIGGFPGEVAERILNRRLYKRAVWVEGGEGYSREEYLEMDTESVERKIAEETGLETEEVLVDPPSGSGMEELSLKIETAAGVRPLGEVSPVVAMLKEAQWENWVLGVYCPEEEIDVVEREARRVLGEA